MAWLRWPLSQQIVRCWGFFVRFSRPTTGRRLVADRGRYAGSGHESPLGLPVEPPDLAPDALAFLAPAAFGNRAQVKKQWDESLPGLMLEIPPEPTIRKGVLIGAPFTPVAIGVPSCWPAWRRRP